LQTLIQTTIFESAAADLLIDVEDTSYVAQAG
jgi:hypothetical protein